MPEMILIGPLALVLAVAPSPAAWAVKQLPEPEAYQAVIDLVFDHTDPVQGESEVILRYLYPQDGSEMQIVIGDLGRGFTVKTWRLPEGSTTILQRMDRLAGEGSKLSVVEVAKLIKVLKESWSVSPSSTLGLLLSGRRALPIPWGSSWLDIHSPSYQLRVRSVETAVSITMRSEARRPLDSSRPVVRWMAQVRAQIEQARSEEKAPPIQ